MDKKTKIVATIGPASQKRDIIKKLVENGVDLFRLNFSHGQYDNYIEIIKNIRSVSNELNRHIGILQDVSGPKIRVSKLEKNFNLEAEDIIIFKRDHNGDFIGKELKPNSDHKLYEISINHPSILDRVEIGEKIYLADGSIKLEIVDINDVYVKTKVLNRGVLSSNKGVNFPNTKLNIDILTDKDKKDIEFGIKHNVDFIALSFVQNSEDVIKAKAFISDLVSRYETYRPLIISKIEKFDAVENIDSIINVSDGIMVARGDLGIEIPYYKVPNIQKNIIKKCNLHGKPVIVATQVLLSMTTRPMATRAEISDVANAVMDGTDAIMLSEETAVGSYPIDSVKTMKNTIIETEKSYNYFNKNILDNKNEAVVYSAIQLAKHAEIDKIFAFTKSGLSARKLAKFRPSIPIFAITHNITVANQLSISFGVHVAAVYDQYIKDTNILINKFIKDNLLTNNFNSDRDYKYLLVAGYSRHTSVNLNYIRVIDKNDLSEFREFKEI